MIYFVVSLGLMVGFTLIGLYEYAKQEQDDFLRHRIEVLNTQGRNKVTKSSFKIVRD